MSSRCAGTLVRVRRPVVLLVVALSAGCSGGDEPELGVARQNVYVGCANPTGTIQVFRLNGADGVLTSKGSVEAGSTVSLAALHPSGKFLYVNHRLEDQVSAFAIMPTGSLNKLNSVPVTGIAGSMRAGPVNVHVDKTGRFLFVPLFQGSNVVVFRLEADGTIGSVVSTHSAGNNAHIVRTDSSNRFALVPFLGSDLIAQYRFDERTGALTPNDPALVKTPEQAGPRHLDFHPSGRWVYLINETAGTVITYAFDRDQGTLSELDSIAAVPEGFSGMPAGGHIQVAPSGRFVYASSRGNNSIAIFSVDQATGRLTALGFEDTRGTVPRNFTLDVSGRVLMVANQMSANLAVFSVDTTSGKLGFLRTQEVCELPFFVRAVPAS